MHREATISSVQNEEVIVIIFFFQMQWEIIISSLQDEK
jgi:hypothetical protein